MTTENWIPLTDYSNKHKVSISTLRRRIKAEEIKYRFQDGKYYLLDQPMGAHPRDHRPSPKSDASSMGTLVEAPSVKAKPAPAVAPIPPKIFSPKIDLPPKKEVTEAFVNKGQNVFGNQQGSEEPILTAANKLLSELKKAYTLVLQEKEEQILQLKEEVADLKTLVKVLEHENERLKPSRRSSPNA